MNILKSVLTLAAIGILIYLLYPNQYTTTITDATELAYPHGWYDYEGKDFKVHTFEAHVGNYEIGDTIKYRVFCGVYFSEQLHSKHNNKSYLNLIVNDNHTLLDHLHEMEVDKRNEEDKEAFYNNCAESCLKLRCDTCTSNVHEHIISKHKIRFKINL